MAFNRFLLSTGGICTAGACGAGGYFAFGSSSDQEKLKNQSLSQENEGSNESRESVESGKDDKTAEAKDDLGSSLTDDKNIPPKAQLDIPEIKLPADEITDNAGTSSDLSAEAPQSEPEQVQ